MTPDPRRGRPSCSALKRLANCPPSFRMSQGLPEVESEDAASGNRIHEWLATGSKESWDAMTGDEQDTGERCLSQRHEVEARWLADIGAEVGDIILNVSEQRLGLTFLGVGLDVKDGDGRDYMITGQPDDVTVVEIEETRYALVIDYKTGRLDVEEARDNDQLRGLAVLVAKRHGCAQVRVSVVQPWCGPPTDADFDSATLAAAEEWLDDVIYNLDVDQPAVAGDWCNYCLAAEIPCPALVAAGTKPVEQAMLTRTLPVDHDTRKAALFARAMEMDAPSLAALLDNESLHKKAWEAIKGAARRRIGDGEAIPGWSLKTTKPKESITAVSVVWEHLAGLGCQPDEFTAACSMTKTKMEPLVRKLTNTKGRDLKAAIGRALEGAVTLGKPSIRLVADGESAELEEGE